VALHRINIESAINATQPSILTVYPSLEEHCSETLQNIMSFGSSAGDSTPLHSLLVELLMPYRTLAALVLSFENSSTNLLYSMKTALLQINEPSRLLNFQFDGWLDGKIFSPSRKGFMNK
jgi:hypothetical protein